MSKVNIEHLIPEAITQLSNAFTDENRIDSVYQGYISSFGVGIVQVGLLPTLAYFESEKNDEERVNQPIAERKIISNLVRDTLHIEAESLLRHVIDLGENERENLTEEIKDASVALKLSMRLFDLGNKNGGAS